MAVFEIDGKEYELKLINSTTRVIAKKYEGGHMAFLGQCMNGSDEALVDAVYYGLKHTGEGFTRKKVEAAIDEKIDNEELDLDGMLSIINEVVFECFFYKAKVQGMLKDKETKEQFETIFGVSQAK